MGGRAGGGRVLRELQVQPRGGTGGGTAAPGWGAGRGRSPAPGAGGESAAPGEAAVRGGRALSRASRAPSEALPGDAHFHSRISAWDLTNVSPARFFERAVTAVRFNSHLQGTYYVRGKNQDHLN